MDYKDQIGHELDTREQCRDKISVWYGSSDNYYHGYKEVLANSIDEISNNFENGVITVTLGEDYKTLTVKDTGRGIPLFVKNENGVENYIILFKRLFGGTKCKRTQVNGDNEEVGTNGLGTCVLNHTSKYFMVKTYHNGVCEKIVFRNGGELVDSSTTECSKQLHGTVVEWQLDEEVYTNTTYTVDAIREIVEVLSGVCNNIKFEFYFKNELVGEYHCKDMLEYFKKISANNTCSPITTEQAIYEIENEVIKIQGIFTSSPNPAQQTFLNRNYLSEGGTIINGFVDGLINACSMYCDEKSLFPKGVKRFKKKDIIDSCSIMCSVLTNNAEYSSQTKLATKKKEYYKYAKEYAETLVSVEIAEHPKNFKKLIDHLVIVSKNNDNTDKAKEKINKQLTKKIEGVGNRPEKLTDCKKHGEEAELYICEGDSAKGQVVQARNSSFQAVIPIRGKILNCLRATLKDIDSSPVIKPLCTAIGTGILDNFDIEKLRYGKIIIMADADADGYQIRELVIIMIWVLMKELILEGHIYIGQTPLYEVKTRSDKVYYAYSETEKEKVLSMVNEEYIIERVKGLGELEPEVMSECAMNPQTRKLVKVTVEDVEQYEKALEIWTGKDSTSRKEIIAENIKDYIERVD